MFITEQVTLFNKAAACAMLIDASLQRGNGSLFEGHMDFYSGGRPENTLKIILDCRFRSPESRRLVDQFVIPAARDALNQLAQLEKGAMTRKDLPNVPFSPEILYAIDHGCTATMSIRDVRMAMGL